MERDYKQSRQMRRNSRYKRSLHETNALKQKKNPTKEAFEEKKLIE